ncbi:hypothetical protein AVEN_53474-1 [Araneus ventricosus]|uniref:Uncharacterized protein n=1 Tax=Araneus ventricosus TaxID=182803 RepID=A0A4Y2AAI2_ARAVE|nr:hypothetical protein AVEN_53474-1 [Araneus ventricosus]
MRAQGHSGPDNKMSVLGPVNDKSSVAELNPSHSSYSGTWYTLNPSTSLVVELNPSHSLCSRTWYTLNPSTIQSLVPTEGRGPKEKKKEHYVEFFRSDTRKDTNTKKKRMALHVKSEWRRALLPPTCAAEALAPSIPFYNTIWVSGSKAPGIDSGHAHAPHCPSNRRPPLTKEWTSYNTV